MKQCRPYLVHGIPKTKLAYNPTIHLLGYNSKRLDAVEIHEVIANAQLSLGFSSRRGRSLFVFERNRRHTGLFQIRVSKIEKSYLTCRNFLCTTSYVEECALLPSSAFVCIINWLWQEQLGWQRSILGKIIPSRIGILRHDGPYQTIVKFNMILQHE